MKVYNSLFQIIEKISYNFFSTCNALIKRIQGVFRLAIANLTKTHFMTNSKSYKVTQGSSNPVVINIAKERGLVCISLQEAVKTKNLETVKKVLEDKVKITQEEFEFAISEAVENGLEDIVQILDGYRSSSQVFTLYLNFLAQAKGFPQIGKFFEKEISLATSTNLEIKQALEYVLKKQDLSFIEPFLSISPMIADQLIELCIEKGFVDIAEALIKKHEIASEGSFYYLVILAKTRGYKSFLQLIIKTKKYEVSELSKRIDLATLEKILLLDDLDLVKYLILKKKFSYSNFLRLSLGMEKKDIVLFLLNDREIQTIALRSSNAVLSGEPLFTLDDLEFLAIVFAAENHDESLLNQLIQKEVGSDTLLLAQHWALIKGNIALKEQLEEKVISEKIHFLDTDEGAALAIATFLLHIQLLNHFLEGIPMLNQAEVRFTIVRALILMDQKDKIVFSLKDPSKDFSDDIFIKAVSNNHPSIVEVILRKTRISDLSKNQAFKIAKEKGLIEIKDLLEKELTKI